MKELTVQTCKSHLNLISSTVQTWPEDEEKATKKSSNIQVVNFNFLATNMVHYCPWLSLMILHGSAKTALQPYFHFVPLNAKSYLTFTILTYLHLLILLHHLKSLQILQT